MDIEVVEGNCPEEEWRKGLRDSAVYLVLGTPDYFKDSVGFDQSCYAKELNKPFVVLLKGVTEIPKGYPMSPNPTILRWDTDEDFKELKRVLPGIIKKL